MKVIYYCGIAGCERSGTLNVDSKDWEKKALQMPCPDCGQKLTQDELHFEDFNLRLHRERAAICARFGPLTEEERVRLREIHELLGHHPAEDFTDEQESLVMEIASTALQKLRNEEKN